MGASRNESVRGSFPQSWMLHNALSVALLLTIDQQLNVLAPKLERGPLFCGVARSVVDASDASLVAADVVEGPCPPSREPSIATHEPNRPTFQGRDGKYRRFGVERRQIARGLCRMGRREGGPPNEVLELRWGAQGVEARILPRRQGKR